MVEHLDVSGSSLADGKFSSKSLYFICSHRRWSDWLCFRRCLHDHPHQTLEKETLQYTPHLVKTVAKEIVKVESSKQIRSVACCSVTIDSKSHLWLHLRQKDIQSFRKMLIVALVKKNSEPLTWPVRKSETQLGPWCLACTWNLAIQILEERSVLCDESTDIDSLSLQPKSSVAALVKKVRDEDYLRLLLGLFMNRAHVFMLKHPVLKLHVLGTIMVDAGSRAASVTNQRVMDTEHGLGNVTGDITLNNIAVSLDQMLWQTKHCQK